MDGENNFAGHLGGANDGPAPNVDNLGGGVGGEGDDINQYYDDAGETFLPADHVSHSNCWLTTFRIALDVSAAKCANQATNWLSRASRPLASRERRRSTQDPLVTWGNWCATVWRVALVGEDVDHFWTDPRQLQHRLEIQSRGWEAARGLTKTVWREKGGGWWAAEACLEGVGRAQSVEPYA